MQQPQLDIGDRVQYKGRLYPIVLVLNPQVDRADYLIQTASNVHVPVCRSEVKNP